MNGWSCVRRAPSVRCGGRLRINTSILSVAVDLVTDKSRCRNGWKSPSFCPVMGGDECGVIVGEVWERNGEVVAVWKKATQELNRSEIREVQLEEVDRLAPASRLFFEPKQGCKVAVSVL